MAYWLKRLLLVLLVLAGIAGIALALLLRTPSPIDAAAYKPAKALPLEGALAPNNRLQQADVLGSEAIEGAEDVDVDPQGRIYGGTLDGRIVRLTPEETGFVAETFAETGGRPLGLAWGRRGALLVADAQKGLLSISPRGEVKVLATGAGGRPFGFTDDLDVARDGTIYFSDASDRFGVDGYLYDLLEARPHGRLMAFRPTTGEVEVLQDGLYFANGVALAEDESFVLVNETYRYRVRRYWLTGVRAGTVDTFVDNLPGFPDGISRGKDGGFWVAMFTVRNPLMDRLHPHPWAKNLLARLPKAVWPKPAPYGLVLRLSPEGEIVESFHDPDGQVIQQVTSAEERGGDLYLGNLKGRGIGRLPLGPPS